MNLSGEIYVQDRVAQYREIWHTAATSLNADFLEIAPAFWEVKLNNRKTIIHNYLVGADNPVKLSIAGNKALCFKLMARAGITIPPYMVFKVDSVEKIKNFMARNGQWYVVKPAKNSAAGLGVTTHIRSYGEAVKAAAIASLYDDEILIEKLIPGESYRLLFLNGHLIHAVKRAGIRITGDGKTPIKDLIRTNYLGNVHEKNDISYNKLDQDPDLVATLQYQKLSLESVIPQGNTVLVKSIDVFKKKYSEVRTSYSDEVTDLISDSILEEAKKTADLFKFELLGVDVITLNPAVSLKETGGVIDEFNTTPGMHHHYNIIENSGVEPPAGKVLAYLLKKESF